jgi:ABC-type antimicrobial peptide transport system ATPase subunit
MNTQELKQFDESYQWWADFLAARREAIHAMHRLGKSFEDIQSTLSLNYPEHAKAIWTGTSSIHEEE